MAPKQSAAARAKALQLKGLQLERKAECVVVCNALRNHYELVVEMKKRMIDLGILLPNGEENPKYTPPRSIMVKDETDDAATSDSPLKRDQKEDDDMIAATVLHRNFTTWGSIPPKYLKWLLGRAETVSLNKFALRAITTPGAKEPPRDPMLDMLEAMTGFLRNDPLGDNSQMEHLSRRVNKRNEETGRILKEVQMPVDWGRIGWYDLAAAASAWLLTQRYSGEQVVIQLDPEMKSGTFPKIINGYSKALWKSGRSCKLQWW